ncbi:MAG TPA: DUF4412 domain-containing protein [Bacteroidia bacterium]|nr:DUF4412 domain-containing protein [Bacteroidia bacterium]
MKKSLILLSILILAFEANSQPFNGTIEFRYLTQIDTNTNVYLVKDNIVRLDQYGKKSNAVEGSFIFDLKSNEIKAVNPKRKTWVLQKSETPQIIRGQCIVTKGASTKKILGYKCQEYIVRNAEENVVITYWITSDKFEFFAPLIKLWNRKDKQSIYFGQISGLSKGSMPLLSEERQLSDGKMLTKLEATKIDLKAPSDESLQIPAGYTKF